MHPRLRRDTEPLGRDRVMCGRGVRRIGRQSQARLWIRLVDPDSLVSDLECPDRNEMIFTGFCHNTDFKISATVCHSLSHSYSAEVPDLYRDFARWFSLGSGNRPMKQLLINDIGVLGKRLRGQQQKKEKYAQVVADRSAYCRETSRWVCLGARTKSSAGEKVRRCTPTTAATTTATTALGVHGALFGTIRRRQ